MESSETMAAPIADPRRVRRVHVPHFIAAGASGIAAVSTKELRGRMRGRRAFVILTIYLLLLGAFAWMVQYSQELNYTSQFSVQPAFASAEIGRAIFTALIMLETLLVVLLAPAFTAGAISLEREKGTIDLLVTTPISSLAIVIGKLLSALIYVFLLIVASIPLTAMVFVFGGVGPDDVVRAYAVLLVSAFGLGSVGLFCSTLVRRTQAATIITYFIVLAITIGALFLFGFWSTLTGWRISAADRPDQNVLGTLSRRAPEAMLYLNPFVAQADVLCGTSTSVTDACTLVNFVTDRSVFDQTFGSDFGRLAPPPNGVIDVGKGGGVGLDTTFIAPAIGFGAGRDVFWPKSAVAWIVVSIILLLLSIQMVSPTRRWRIRGRLRRPRLRRRTTEVTA